MRVLLVPPFVAPIDDRAPHLAGAQAIISDLARGLAARGHRVTLLAARGSHVTGASVVDLGIDSAGLRPAHFAPGVRRTDEAAQRRVFGSVRAWLDERRDGFDVVHARAYDSPAFDALRGAGLLRWVEPFGLVAIEAQAAGAPVVSYRCGGLAEIVEDGLNGFVVDPGDEVALAAAVGRLGALDRAAVRRSVEERYSLAAMLDAYESLYAEVTRA